MSDRIFLDTNIFVYAFDNRFPEKQSQAKIIIRDYLLNKDYFISSQVLSEFGSVVSQKMNPPLSPEEIIEFFNDLPQDQIIDLNKGLIIRALGLKSKYSLSYWDSMIVSTALASNCSILYTEDMQEGLIIENSLRITNPFI